MKTVHLLYRFLRYFDIVLLQKRKQTIPKNDCIAGNRMHRRKIKAREREKTDSSFVFLSFAFSIHFIKMKIAYIEKKNKVGEREREIPLIYCLLSVQTAHIEWVVINLKCFYLCNVQIFTNKLMPIFLSFARWNRNHSAMNIYIEFLLEFAQINVNINW